MSRENTSQPQHTQPPARAGTRSWPPFRRARTTASAPQHRAHAADDKNGDKRRRPGRIALIVVAILIVGAYVAGVVAFSQICYPNTNIAEVDVSAEPCPSNRAGAEAAQDYTLTIDGHGFTWAFEPEQGSDVFDAAQAVDRVLAANEPLMWPVRLVQALGGGASARAHATENGKAPELPSQFDRDAFSTELTEAIEAFNAGRTGTFDAAGAYDEQAAAFTVQKARSNQKIYVDALDAAALEAIAELTPTLSSRG